MISGNVRAATKIASTFGYSYLEAAIGNELYRKPTVERQNFMLDYGKNIYNLKIDTLKFKTIYNGIDSNFWKPNSNIKIKKNSFIAVFSEITTGGTFLLSASK